MTEVLPDKLKNNPRGAEGYLKEHKVWREAISCEKEGSPADSYTSPPWQIHCVWALWLWHPKCQLVLRGEIGPWTRHSHSCASVE